MAFEVFSLCSFSYLEGNVKVTLNWTTRFRQSQKLKPQNLSPFYDSLLFKHSRNMVYANSRSDFSSDQNLCNYLTLKTAYTNPHIKRFEMWPKYTRIMSKLGTSLKIALRRRQKRERGGKHEKSVTENLMTGL